MYETRESGLRFGLLQSLPNTLCLVVNHENCCANIYSGNDRSLMMCNTLFRLGGAAIFLSNRCVPPQPISRSGRITILDLLPTVSYGTKGNKCHTTSKILRLSSSS